MKIKKYSTIQRYSYFPNEYRVKNYITKKWEYIKRLNGFWIFKDNNGMKVFCRPTSISKITLLKD